LKRIINNLFSYLGGAKSSWGKARSFRFYTEYTI